MSAATAAVVAEIPKTLEELQTECSKLLLEEIGGQEKLNEASAQDVTKSLLQVLCKLDALEDRYDSKTLNILHFNDTYNLSPKNSSKPNHAEAYGGFGRFATVLKQEQEKFSQETGAKPMILFSGDFVGPSLTSAISQGTHVLHAMNSIGVHYGTFGNHEFDFGLQKLVDILAGKVDEGEHDHGPSVTTWIASNMNGADGKPIAGAEKQVIVDWEGGVKVGLLGCSENWLPGCSQLGEGEANYLDHIAETNRLCQEMRAQGVEVILALTHSRLDGDKEFARLCPDVDVVLGGHDHFNYLNLDERIIKGGEEWKFLNSVQIKLKKNVPGAKPHVTCRQIPIFYEIEQDEKAQEIERLYTDFISARMDNFVADVITDRFQSDLAIIQGYQIAGKYVLEAGDVRLRDVYSWFPKGTTAISVKLKGAQIVELFENSVRSLPGECGGFPHVSKLVRYTVDANLPPGNRVSDVRFGADLAPIDLEKDYTVGVTSDLGNSRGFGVDFMCDAPRVISEEYEVPITDMIVEHFEKRKMEPIDTTEASKHGRVIELHKGEDTALVVAGSSFASSECIIL